VRCCLNNSIFAYLVIAIMEIIGYLVYLVNNEVTTQDILYQNRVLYPKWEEATAAAGVLAQKTSNEYTSKPICLLRSASRTICHDIGYTTAFRLHSADILIFPVHASLP
jgi:hypothetical protein